MIISLQGYVGMQERNKMRGQEVVQRSDEVMTKTTNEDCRLMEGLPRDSPKTNSNTDSDLTFLERFTEVVQ